MKKIDFLVKARNLHGYKYNYLNLSYKVTLGDKIDIEYDGEVYTQTVSKHLMGRCPEKAIKKKTTEEFIEEAKRVWGDKYDYSKTEYTGALNEVKIIYNGIVYLQRASSHLLGLSPEFRNNEESLLRNMIYESDLIGIKEIKEFLDKYCVDYNELKKFDTLVFQFYIPSKRTVIEYQSNKHYLIRELDKSKEDYCEENYIDFIRISYHQFDDIYQILWENLKTVISK